MEQSLARPDESFTTVRLIPVTQAAVLAPQLWPLVHFSGMPALGGGFPITDVAK
jgi:hypothetical protein